MMPKNFWLILLLEIAGIIMWLQVLRSKEVNLGYLLGGAGLMLAGLMVGLYG